MANTFKLKSNANMPASAGTPLTLYTCPGSTTTICLGLLLCNNDTSQRTVDVKIESDTSDTETNVSVYLAKSVSLPSGSSLELLSGGKVVFQTTDILKIGSRPLGEILFDDPEIKRGHLEVGSFQNSWARRSTFTIGKTNLLVTEIFLESLYA